VALKSVTVVLMIMLISVAVHIYQLLITNSKNDLNCES
jgi:hypothetical protein